MENNIIDFSNPGICTGFKGHFNTGHNGCEVVEEYNCRHCDCWHIGNFKETSFKVHLKLIAIADKDKVFVQPRNFNVSVVSKNGRTISLGNYTLRAAEALIKQLSVFGDKELNGLFIHPMTDGEKNSWFTLADREQIKTIHIDNVITLSPDRNHTIH